MGNLALIRGKKEYEWLEELANDGKANKKMPGRETPWLFSGRIQ